MGIPIHGLLAASGDACNQLDFMSYAHDQIELKSFKDKEAMLVLHTWSEFVIFRSVQSERCIVNVVCVSFVLLVTRRSSQVTTKVFLLINMRQRYVVMLRNANTGYRGDNTASEWGQR